MYHLLTEGSLKIITIKYENANNRETHLLVALDILCISIKKNSRGWRIEYPYIIILLSKRVSVRMIPVGLLVFYAEGPGKVSKYYRLWTLCNHSFSGWPSEFCKAAATGLNGRVNHSGQGTVNSPTSWNNLTKTMSFQNAKVYVINNLALTHHIIAL